jgi:FMN reductase
MANVLTINRSPSVASKTRALLSNLTEVLVADGHEVHNLNLRELPAEDLMHARASATEIAAAVSAVEVADGVVIGTPIYKAAYSGLLKTFLDLLPQFAFEKKVLLPLATGGSLAHVLALDYGLRPVLTSLGAQHVVGSYFVLDRGLQVDERGVALLEAETNAKYLAAVGAFTDSLRRHAPSGVAALAGT